VDEEDLSEDEKTLEKEETFERKFNFRYEEPDTEYVSRYRCVGPDRDVSSQNNILHFI
jgi:hypothetical protein